MIGGLNPARVILTVGLFTTILSGCAGASPTAISATSPTTPVLGPSPSAPTAGITPTTSVATIQTAGTGAVTAGSLASSGKALFAQNCAACHGDKGQGVTAPALIGPSRDLAKYKTGQGLYDFVSSNMPQNSPGSLTSDAYLDIVTYLVVQNGDATSSQPLGTALLKDVQFKKP